MLIYLAKGTSQMSLRILMDITEVLVRGRPGGSGSEKMRTEAETGMNKGMCVAMRS